MTQPYTIKTVPHRGQFFHRLMLYRAEIAWRVTPYITPPEDMVYRMISGNCQTLTGQSAKKCRAAT